MNENLKRKAKKLLDNSGNEFLTQLEATMDLADKLDSVVEAVKSIPETIIPETIIPEYPSEMVITNLPDIQRVEVINPPKEKDDKEVQKLLKELVAEVKKKEEYAYDIEIDPVLKEQLRGEKGADGKDGKDGTEITPSEVVLKLESLEDDERLDVSAIRGTEALIENIVNDKISKIPKPKVTSGVRASSSSSGIAESFETVSSNLPASNAVLNYDGNGDITDIVYSNGITKTFNYTGGDITSIVLSGSTPSGITLTKTLTYTDGDVTGITYS